MEELEADAVEDYENALNELTCNSKPHINMLTMLADEKKKFASKIVQIIETRINQVQNTQKLPLLYLIDSIVKNCPDSPYKDCFAKNLTNTFVKVFENGDEKTRGALFKLRQTWPAIFPASRLLHIDIKVHNIDHAWPLVDPKSTNKQGTSIHVNPKFLSSNPPPKTIVAEQESPKLKDTQVRLPTNSSQIDLQNVQDPRRIQKELQVPINKPVVNQSFANALSSGPSSRDPRIRNAMQKRGPEFVDSSPVEEDYTPTNSYMNRSPTNVAERTYAKKIVAPLPAKVAEKKFVKNDERPTPKPMSVVAKVAPRVSVVAEPGRWKFCDDNSKHASLVDVGKIAKLPANRDSSKRTEIFRSSVVDRDKRNDFIQTSPMKNPRGGGGGGRGSVADRNRVSGRGRNGGGQQNFAANDYEDNPRKSSINHNYHERRQLNETQKRQRSRSPNDETVVKSKRERTFSKSRRDDELPPTAKDRDERDLSRKNIKDSSNYPSDSPTKIVRSQPKLSFAAAAAADTDLRNNSTDSDRSGRDVDFRTSLPLKKRKRSDDDSTSTPESFPLDQVLPPKDEKFKKKQSPKSDVYLDELLFGPNEDHDMRFSKQRLIQQSPKSNRNNSKPSSVVDRDKRPTAKISVDAPILPDESVDSLVEYRANIVQRAEQQTADGSMSPQSYDEKPAPKRNVGQAPPYARKPKSGPNFPSTSTNRPKMRPIPKTTQRAPTSGSTPVFQNPATSNVADRQSMRPPYARSGLPAPPPKPLMNFNTRFPIDQGLNQPLPEPIPSNNRILVDGISYEVKYIDHVPVIERNGLPHRTRFVGVGRDVVIDDVPYSLKFDETKDILIDGQMHKIRFGGPSRELYMGNYPFRGSFGGPEILATINGMKHRILLSGPAPEVKIDPEPSMDLVRFPLQPQQQQILHPPEYSAGVGAVSSLGGFPTPPSSSLFVHKTLLPTPAPSINLPPPPPVVPQSMIVPPPVPAFQQPAQVDVHDLLNKLVTTGIISSTVNVANSVQTERKPAAPAPIESADGTMRSTREAPPNLKDFNISVLKIRYAPIVRSLYQERIQCSTCGMRFVVGDQQKYSQHLDWHFKQNRLEKNPGRLMSRPWYFAAEDWVNFEEFAAPKAKSTVFENAPSKSDEISNRSIVASTHSVITATRDDQNECAVCHEKFEQFWDEDEEAWKLRNATLVDDKAYHPLCYQDVSNVERDFVSPGFGSPVNDKPLFWACDDPIIAAAELPPSTASGKTEPDSEPTIDDAVALPSSSSSSTLNDVLPSFITDAFQKSFVSSSDDGAVKRIASSQDLLQSVLSVVSNVPTGLVNNLTSISSPLNVNKENSSSSSNDDDDSRTVKVCVNNLKVNNDNSIDFFDDLLLYDDHKTASAADLLPSNNLNIQSDPASSTAEHVQRISTATFVGLGKTTSSSNGGSSGGTTPLRDERLDSPGTPVHDEAACF